MTRSDFILSQIKDEMYREVAKCIFMDGLTNQETAEATDYSVRQICRIKKKLAPLFEKRKIILKRRRAMTKNEFIISQINDELYRKVARCLFVQGFKAKETGEICGYSERHIYRIKKKLAPLFETYSIISIANEDGTLLSDGFPVNPLKEKWDKLYPAVPKPELSQVCDGYSCMYCDRCYRGNNWKIPKEDLAIWREYQKQVKEYIEKHNPEFSIVLSIGGQ